MVKFDKTLPIAILLFVSSFTFYGCATSKGSNLSQQGLRNQIQVLQTQLIQKDEEIIRLRNSLSGRSEKKDKPVAVSVIIPGIKQIQIALMNAGYNPGPIDGKIGKKTRMAIKNFQRKNNLKVDGKVGKKTWRLLKKYLR